MDVSDVLRGRMEQPAGLQRRAAVVSMLIHGAVLAIFLLAPRGWFSQRTPEARSVMTISLGGGNSGPENGGITTIGGRAVQAVKVPDAPREAVRAPAARTPEMTVPVPNSKPVRNPPKAPVKQAPEEARGSTPSWGVETSPGTAIAEMGAWGMGFGLSTGGGTGTGSRLDITGDFCCPEYIILMVEKIRANWNQRVDATGETVVVFTIEQDGRLTNIMTERTSGFQVLDLNAVRAVAYTRQLTALPESFTNPTLKVYLNFQYQR
jgi:TonB family protein